VNDVNCEEQNPDIDLIWKGKKVNGLRCLFKYLMTKQFSFAVCANVAFRKQFMKSEGRENY
jgi:hypothetical protein